MRRGNGVLTGCDAAVRRWLAVVLLAGVSLAYAPAAQAQFTVTNNNDSGAGSLRAAIAAANAAGGTPTITFSNGYTSGASITLSSELPVITSNVTINGNGLNPVINGNGFRPFLIGDAGQTASPSVADLNTYAVTLQNLSVTGSKAQGGSGAAGGGGGAGLGGAVLVTSNGALTLTNVSLTSNAASGGSGASYAGSSSGGGGGLGGSSTSASGSQGTGGGGLSPTTGNVAVGSGSNGGGSNGGAGSSSAGSPGGFGGGGGGAYSSGGPVTAGFGGFGGGGGGAHAPANAYGGNGGYGGGGGAAGGGSFGFSQTVFGGNGGFGGGGAGAVSFGGGGNFGAAGNGGFGGGAGASQSGAGGGGGLGAGGAVYVQSGGTVAISGSLTINGNSVTAGAAIDPMVAGNGSAFGSGIFFQSTMGSPSTLSFGVGVQSIGDDIADYLGSGGTNPNSGANANDQGGSLVLAKTGGGTLTLAGTNTYSGGTSVGAGSTVVVTNSSSIGSGNFAFDGGTFQVQSGTGPLAFTNNATITGNGGTFDANGEQLTWNGVVGNASGIPPGTPGTLTIASTISGGAVTFTGTNTYTGGTVINSGATLALSDFGSIANSSSVTANGTFDISGVSPLFTVPITTLAGAGAVSLGHHNLQMTNASTEFSGVISDGGNFGGIEIGSGTLTLSGVNTYSDFTQIDGSSKLVLKGNGSIANSVVSFVGTGTLDISQTGGTSIGGLYSPTNAASNVFLGAQTLTITNGANYLGVIQDGGIAGGTGGGLTISAFAQQSLAGVNTYTGLTTIDSFGELDLYKSGSHIGSISNSAAVINNGVFDISSLSNGVAHASTLIKSLSGTDASAIVYLGSNTLTLTNASGTYAGILQDGGNNGGMGGALSITGGTEVLTGASTYTGATTVTGATLDVEGSLNALGQVSVNTVGKLMGGGAAGAVTIDGTSTFAPGNGTPNSSMTVASLALLSGAQYVVQLNPTTASFAKVSGNASLGNATVDAVWATGGYLSKQYMILTAASITGTFNPTVVNTNLPANVQTVSLSYDAALKTAYLNLMLNFSIPGGLNGNQQNVGNALTNFFVTTGGIPGAFTTLSPGGLSQASGETATGTQQATFDAMSLFMSLLTDQFGEGRTGATGGATPFAEEIDAANAYAAKDPSRTKREREAFAAVYRKAPMADVFSPSWNVWAAGFGGSQTTSGNAALGSNDTTSRVFGTAVGVDYRFSPNTIAGFALAGGGTNFSVANAGSGRSDLFQAGAFVRHTVGAAYFTAALAYGWQDITTNRTVTIAGIDQLQARFRANAFSGRIEDGYRFATPWMGLTPYAAAQFTTFDLPAYAEQAIVGANTFALAYTAKSVTDVRSEVGLRTDKSWAMQDSLLTLRGRFAWAHDYNTDRSIGATFQTLPGASFVVNGAAQSADKALTSASAEMKWRSGFSLAGTFEGEFSGNSSSYAGKGVARYQW